MILALYFLIVQKWTLQPGSLKKKLNVPKPQTSQSHMITYPVLLFIIIFRSAGLEIGGFNVTLGTKLLHSLSGLTLVNYRSTILTHHLRHHNSHCNCNSPFLPQIITVLLNECNPITNA